jgi:hypothetical protein
MGTGLIVFGTQLDLESNNFWHGIYVSGILCPNCLLFVVNAQYSGIEYPCCSKSSYRWPEVFRYASAVE